LLEKKWLSYIIYDNMIMSIIDIEDYLGISDFNITIVFKEENGIKKEALSWKINHNVLSFKVAKITYDVSNYRAIVVKKYD